MIKEKIKRILDGLWFWMLELMLVMCFLVIGYYLLTVGVMLNLVIHFEHDHSFITMFLYASYRFARIRVMAKHG